MGWCHRNVKTRSRIKPWKVKNVVVGAPQNNKYIELCAKENLGKKIQLMV
jgi:hypothetical protein